MYLIALHRRWLFPLIWLILITPLTPKLDLEIEHYFFEDHHFSNNAFFTFLYNYGCWPTLAFFGFILFAFVATFFYEKLKKWRNPFLILTLSFVLGTGLVVHVILKDHWGRPRPKQVVEFGGEQNFRPYYSPNFFHQPEPSKSFPCGHCSMGFYFFSLAILGKRISSKYLMQTGFALAFSLGVLLSISRMAQGGHFFSDTLLSAYIMWTAALICDWIIYEKKYIC